MFHTLRKRKAVPTLEAGSLIFFYGTLRSGEHNHHVIQELLNKKHACLISPVAYVAETCVVDIGGFPGLYPTFGEAFAGAGTTGEVYAITKVGRCLVDLFEGAFSLYRPALKNCHWLSAEWGNISRIVTVYLGPRPPIAQGGLLGEAVFRKPADALLSDWAARRTDGEAETRPVFLCGEGGVGLHPPEQLLEQANAPVFDLGRIDVGEQLRQALDQLERFPVREAPVDG